MILEICTSISLCVLSFICIKLNYHQIVKENINTSLKKWKRINNLVSTRHKNKMKIILTSLNMIRKAFYLSFVQYLNNSVRKLDKNIFEISYTINGKIYRMIAVTKKGPTPILQIINSDEEDVTDMILPYLGPNYDWHGTQIYPNFFKTESLTFELSNGSEVTYNNENITNILS